MDDRRKFSRKRSTLDITCQIVDEPYVSFKARGLVISQSGMELRLKKHCALSEFMRITISNPSWKEPVVAKCKVVWESAIPGTDEKKVGLEFVDIPWNRINQLMGGI